MSSFTYTVTAGYKPSSQSSVTKLHITVKDKDGKVLTDRDV